MNRVARRPRAAARRPVCFPVLEPAYADVAAMAPILANEFTFNGETHRLPTPVPWTDNPSEDREWHIALHKFYYAPGLGAAYRATGDTRYLEHWMTLTASWIAAVEPGYIAADVTGRRIQNWVYAYAFFVDEGVEASIPSAFLTAFEASLEVQVNWLFEHLHAKRNHRTLELHALLLAGVMFPSLRGPVCWRDWALRALCDNIAADLLPDGVHCELASDYHHIVLRNYLGARRLCVANDIAFPAESDAALGRALDFALHAHKPDGAVPALSDGDARAHRDVLALGALLYAREDLAYSASGGREGTAPASLHGEFASGGYCFMRSGWGESEPYADARYVAFDCGGLGEGNHGHLDALSIELAAYGRSLVVDPGRYTYHEGGAVNWRVRFRETAAHNTVLVDGLNQTRYRPGSGRYKIAGPAPRTRLLACSMRGASGYLCGEARSAEYDAVHRREIFFPAGRYWVVVDELAADAVHRYEQRFQLAEFAHGRVELSATAAVHRVHSPSLLIAADGAAECRIEDGQLAYRYGTLHPAPRVVFSRHGANVRLTTVLVPYRDEPPALEIEVVSVPWHGDTRCRLGVLVTLLERGQRTRDFCLGRTAGVDDAAELPGVILRLAPDGGLLPLLGGIDPDFASSPAWPGCVP